MNAADRFEYATAQDPALNYCLWDYPAPAPAEDKFRSVNLLFQSFDHAGVDARAFDVVEALRDGIGPFRTVFGTKLIGQRLGWEFYFYDYKRRQREVSITRVLDALRPLMPCPIVPNENLPYFMFSLDLDDDLATGRRPLDVVHMYIGNPGSTVSSGIAYALRTTGATLENFYFFFDAPTQLTDVAKKVVSSAHFDDTQCRLDAVMVPELRECRTICVANKQTHDCIYFSGVDVGQLLWFLETLQYPPPIVDFVRDNRASLDHLLFDVGFDYRFDNGALRVLKSGYYGVF
ncbi:MAG: hypothetical protein AB7O80_24440 [Acetobacteraceae bacterium]